MMERQRRRRFHRRCGTRTLDVRKDPAARPTLGGALGDQAFALACALPCARRRIGSGPLPSERERDRLLRRYLCESEVEHAPTLRISAERRNRHAIHPLASDIDHRRAVLEVNARQLHLGDGDATQGPERHERAVRVLSFELDAGRHVERDAGKADGDVEREHRVRGTRRLRRKPDQREKLLAVACSDAIEPKHIRFGHPREQLDERDTGIVDVVIGPSGRVARNQGAPLLHQVRPAAIVEVRQGQRHGVRPPAPASRCASRRPRRSDPRGSARAFPPGHRRGANRAA